MQILRRKHRNDYTGLAPSRKTRIEQQEEDYIYFGASICFSNQRPFCFEGIQTQHFLNG